MKLTRTLANVGWSCVSVHVCISIFFSFVGGVCIVRKWAYNVWNACDNTKGRNQMEQTNNNSSHNSTEEQKASELRSQTNIKQRIIGIAFYVREIFQLAQIHTHKWACKQYYIFKLVFLLSHWHLVVHSQKLLPFFLLHENDEKKRNGKSRPRKTHMNSENSEKKEMDIIWPPLTAHTHFSTKWARIHFAIAINEYKPLYVVTLYSTHSPFVNVKLPITKNNMLDYKLTRILAVLVLAFFVSPCRTK